MDVERSSQKLGASYFSGKNYQLNYKTRRMEWQMNGYLVIQGNNLGAKYKVPPCTDYI